MYVCGLVVVLLSSCRLSHSEAVDEKVGAVPSP